MVSNTVTLTKTQLIVEPTLLNKILGLKGKITIPIEHIDGATIDEGILQEGKGVKAPGANFPGKSVGTWHKNGEKVFYNLNHKEVPVVISLSHEELDRLVLGVENPKDFVNTLNKMVL